MAGKEERSVATGRRMDLIRDIFGRSFLLSHRLEYIVDRSLEADNLTAKQLIAMIVISGGFESPPSVSQVAELLGTSRQNVKQIALNLERGGFMSIERDGDDRRVLRLSLTDKAREFFGTRQAQHEARIRSLFDKMADSEVADLHRLLLKFLGNVDEVYADARAGGRGEPSGEAGRTGDPMA